ncbi:prepilin-type N-terminal cleavage/methylation domain-containing protein [Candidatus Parcubacteria bacterium]|nr:MAG: prepilin-type N-terminal cleavage/methylation domain-containing protein [Candidatus Parcubacteria bacterium]
MEGMRNLGFRKGLTLLELLVTISLTTLLSSLVISYGHVGRQQVSLYVEASKVAQLILRAKALAVTTYNQPIVPCGYGVEVDYARGVYTLFSYDVPNCNVIALTGINSVNKTPLTSVSVQAGLMLQLGLDSLRDVLFLPPNPTTLVSTDSSGAIGSRPGKVYLQTPNASANATIVVTQTGEVSF